MKFSDVLEVKNGRNQRQVEDPDGRYPIYGSGGIIGRANDYICGADTVVIGRKGSINNPIFVHEPFWNVDTAFGLIANREVLLPKYLYYFCLHFDFERLNKTVTIPSLTRESILKIEIEMPTLSKQREIVAIIDEVCSLINLQHQRIKHLNQIVESQFVEMFGDLRSNSKNLPIKELDEIASSRLGKMLDSKNQTGKHRKRYLTNKNVQWFRFDLSELNAMDFTPDDQVEFSLQRGDLLVCEGGEVGRCAIWQEEIADCYFQKALHRVRCNDSVIPEYLAWWFKIMSNEGLLTKHTNTSTIAHLSGAKLKKLRVIIPPLSQQKQFAKFAFEVDKSQFAIKQVIEKLGTLKGSLMQRYFG